MIKLTTSALLLVSAMAGAQTVTVGSTTSTQNGTTTTITVPVSVAVPPPTTTVAPTNLASLRVDTGNSSGNATTQTFTTFFKTVMLANVVTDSASGWNPVTSTYTAPNTGTYLIISTVRLVDALPAGISWGQGVHTSTADNPAFLWVTTAGPRNGFVNSRIMQLSAGQTVSLFLYADSLTPIALSGASLNIQQIQ